MPFASLFKTQYERVIRPAIEEYGLRCVRGDEIYSKPRIMDDIWKSIRAARLVVAELTGKNPNVLYEVGLAQAIGKPVIILTRNEDDVPFDLKALRYLFYQTDNPFWGEDLKEQLKSMVGKVLREDAFSGYLEGIKPVSEFSFPVQQEKIPSSDKPPRPIPNLVGVWRASPDLNMPEVSSFEKVLNLSQEGETLSGVEVITYFFEDAVTVVQLTLTGIIQDNSVTLNGTSYTFIQRGMESGYSLDNYELQLSSDNNEMKGRMISAVGNTYDIVWTRTTADQDARSS